MAESCAEVLNCILVFSPLKAFEPDTSVTPAFGTAQSQRPQGNITTIHFTYQDSRIWLSNREHRAGSENTSQARP